MSTTRVAIHVGPGAEEHFDASECGNYFVKDTSPVTDDTEICVNLGEGSYITTTIGRWKALVGAAFLGIEAIPAKREERLERERRCRDREAKRDAEAVPA